MHRTHKYLTLSLLAVGLALLCLPLAGRSQSVTNYWNHTLQTLRTSFGASAAVSNSKTPVTPASPIVAGQAQKRPCLSYAECMRTQTQTVESTSSRTATPTTRRANRASTEAIMTLYDQTNNPGGFDITYQDFEAGLEPFDNEAADDFVVPAPGWQIQRIEILGSFIDNGGGLGAPTIDVTFYSATGAPGNTLPNAVLYTFPAVTPAANVNGNFTLDLPGGGASFPPGTYWMQLQVNYPIAGGQYFWVTRAVQSNSGAVWRQPGDGNGTGATNFTRLPDVGGVGAGGLGTLNPDLLFRLSGTLAPGLMARVYDPAICLEPGGLVAVQATLTNPNNSSQPSSLVATLPAGLTGVAGSCTTDVAGPCTVNAGTVTWNGTLAAGQSVNIFYRARIGANVAPNAQLCINNVGNVNGFMATAPACVNVVCPVIANIGVSDQKAGSVLVFPYYTSTIGGASDTRISISNTSAAAPTVANQTYVHLFLIDGLTCQQADLFLCLTPNASFSFKASEYDPGNTGYVIAVAVNNQGVPIQNNVLIGNAFVNTPNFADNYGAESFWANSPSVASVSGSTATLFFDGAGYDPVPKQFAVEIQSPVDVAGQQIVTASLNGDLTASSLSGAAQVGTGQAFNEKEVFGSFSAFVTGGCQARGIISTTSPRVPNGLGTLIKTGQAGSLKFNVGGAVGLIMTPRTAAWKGIRTLHKTQATATTLTIPVFIPAC